MEYKFNVSDLPHIAKEILLKVPNKTLLFYGTMGVGKTTLIKEISKQFSSSTDKASIYRALDSFEKSGLIHQVPDKNNLLRYSLCKSECKPNHHAHDHAHFLCSVCEETFCLDDFKFPTAKSHNGFLINELKIIMEGTCVSCKDI